MLYSEILEIVRTAAESYKGSLSFGNGTLEQLNGDDGLNYPICWVAGVNQAVPIQTSGVMLQTFTLTIHVLESGSIEQDIRVDNDMYDSTLAIANGLIAKIYKTFDEDNDSVDSIQAGTLTQVFRKQDSVHIGWQFTITIQTYWDERCCADFE